MPDPLFLKNSGLILKPVLILYTYLTFCQQLILTALNLGVLGATRTHNLWLRRPTFYPIELRGQDKILNFELYYYSHILTSSQFFV